MPNLKFLAPTVPDKVGPKKSKSRSRDALSVCPSVRQTREL